MTHGHNHIHLIGDPQENFYILGKKDKDSYSEMYEQISMLCTRNTKVSKLLKITTELSGQLKKKYGNTQSLKELEAYSEGLEIPTNDVLYALLLPEIVASFNKWVPNLLGLIPGCSSLFFKDPHSNGVIHNRILDYALSGPFEKYERSILYDFKDRNRVFSFSSSGMPFPSMTAMNEEGLTLALHYKHGQYFNTEGESIFFLTNEIMNTCANIREAIKLIKSKQSISYWGIYLSDQNGEIASIDIRGNEIYQEKFDIKDHNYLYFNNRPLLRQNDLNSIQPFGNLNLCQMKRNTIEKRLKNFTPQDSKNPMLDGLKLLGKLENKKSSTAKNWDITPITPSSIQMVSFNNSSKESICVAGDGPKSFQNPHYTFQKIFNDLKITNSKKVTKENQIQKGYKLFAQFQSHIDKGEITLAYHKLQMAILTLEGLSEYYIAQFYYAITQYIYESDNRDLTYIFHDLEALENKLPAYLEDHRKLFLLRLGKIIGHKLSNDYEKIQNKHLQKVYQEEYKLNAISIKGLKYLIFPRIEILDIIYAY